MNRVFICLGQGAQYYSMGRSLLEREPVFRGRVEWGSEYLETLINRNFLSECIDVPLSSKPFNDILLSHPGLVIIQVALAETLQAHDVYPTAVWGNSIGEYAAAVIAQCCSFEDAIFMATQQAMLLQKHCAKGAMLAVLADKTTLDQCLPSYTLAGINFDSHHILSGSAAEVDELEVILKEHGVTTHRLPVTYGFHSPEIEPAKESILQAQRALSLKQPACTYYSSMTASACENLSIEHFWHTIRNPIQFQSTFQKIVDNDVFYIDLSPTATATTFFKYNAPAQHGLKCYPVLNPLAPQKNGIDAIVEQLVEYS